MDRPSDERTVSRPTVSRPTVPGLTAALLERARAEGLHLVGVARAGPASGAAALERWLAAGMHGEMAYMERTAAVREDPRLLLPGCRSVVAVAISYHTAHPLSTEPREPGRVWVSRYAWGRDYHRLLKRRLIRLGRWLARQCPGASWRAAVDTAPLLEREWAARAGLGWIGKSTSLINRRLGSELFLGALLTDIELEPNEPVPSHCGRCTACLDACPTGALVAPGVLDARRCISYLTIEHRSPIPEPLRPRIGTMIAGCDICQEVCPWTRRAPAGLSPELEPSPHRYSPWLELMESLDEDAYREWRRASPLGRISFAQMRRNLNVARHNLVAG
jgi:epoxyqueuosine reductase